MPVIGKQSLRREGSSFGEGIDFQQEYRNSVANFTMGRLTFRRTVGEGKQNTFSH
jgi:hypothetical protein